MQRQLAATEAEFRCALQEGARDCGDMRRDLEVNGGSWEPFLERDWPLHVIGRCKAGAGSYERISAKKHPAILNCSVGARL